MITISLKVCLLRGRLLFWPEEPVHPGGCGEPEHGRDEAEGAGGGEHQQQHQHHQHDRHHQHQVGEGVEERREVCHQGIRHWDVSNDLRTFKLSPSSHLVPFLQ